MTTHTLDSMNELDSRITDGIHVRLMWSQADDRAVVAVDDAKTGDSFVVAVQSDERAMDVFHHPYAYAAVHRIPTRSPVFAVT